MMRERRSASAFDCDQTLSRRVPPRRAVVLFLVLVALTSGSRVRTPTILAAEELDRPLAVFVPREDKQVALHNPDMGWVVYENYPLDRDPKGSSTLLALPNEIFQGVDSVALMFTWADVEPAEGKYDFQHVDFAFDYWKKRGKAIQLRLSSESLLWWTNRMPPTGMGVPDYVLRRLPDELKQRRIEEGEPHYWCVDARHPYYRERLRAFLAEVHRRYPPPAKKGDRPVTLVDLRGFGKWGEWHSGYRYATVDERREALRAVLDDYSRAFPGQWLSLSYSYDPDSPREYYAGPTHEYDEKSTARYSDFLSYSAFDHALTLPNVTLRRDGAGGAVHTNERKLCETAFHSRTRGPMMCEFLGGFAAAKKGREGWIDFMVDDALSLHPNYVNLLGWQGQDALDFLQQRPDLIARGLRTMGYRFVPIHVELKQTRMEAKGNADAGLMIASEWVNRGVGRAMREYEARWTIAARDGSRLADSGWQALPTARWIQGETYSIAQRIEKLREPLATGEYRLLLELRDPRDHAPIQLPLSDVAASGTYVIGEFEVTASR